MNRAPRFFSAMVLIFFMFCAPPLLRAVDVTIDSAGYFQKTPLHYQLNGVVTNMGGNTLEVVLRGELVFYDAGVRKGDIPLRVLRKDITVIIKPGQNYPVLIDFFMEGKLPRASVRIEPVLRARRERVWLY